MRLLSASTTSLGLPDEEEGLYGSSRSRCDPGYATQARDAADGDRCRRRVEMVQLFETTALCSE